MKRILAIVALVGLVFGFVGCGGQPAASGPATNAEKAAETAAAAEPIIDLNPASTGTAAAAATVDIPADASPDEVVTAFLEARRSGDPKTTAALLTSTARSATAKHKIDVNGEALPDLQFQVAKPKYLKNNPKGAHVSSLWTELLPDGTKASYEVVWVLRKEAAGWRVAGFAAVKHFQELRASQIGSTAGFAEQENGVARLLKRLPRDVPFVLDEADHADRGRRIDHASRALVV